MSENLVLPESFGFCGGVAAADELISRVAESASEAGVAVYGLHEIVHNKDVVRRHEASGVTFVDDLEEVPAGSAVVVSAHGVGPQIYKEIADKSCEAFDATCPLVIHTHKGVQLARERNEKVIYVCHGKPGEVNKLHDEVAGTVGHMDYRLDEGELIYDPVERIYLELDESLDNIDWLSADAKYRVITQTTLHADDCIEYREQIRDAILKKQPDASVSWANKGDVCRAVSDRQNGVAQLVELRPGRIVVATDPGSKNGMGYFALAQKLVAEAGADTTVHAVANAEQAADIEHIEGIVGLTASASTPNSTISEIAKVFGRDEEVRSLDRTFNLRDSDQAVIDQKISNLAEGA